MNESEQKNIAFKLMARIETGFSFIEDKYLVQQRNSGGPDMAWLRSVYILFSYHFELLLKLALVLTHTFKDEKELNAKLKRLGHNLEAIGSELGGAALENIGITNIFLQNGEYTITTIDKKIYVKDFNDIRYDFIGGKIRNISANEDSIIKESLEGAYDILKKIKNIHFKQ
jgi:hypothetical protein